MYALVWTKWWIDGLKLLKVGENYTCANVYVGAPGCAVQYVLINTVLCYTTPGPLHCTAALTFKQQPIQL